MKHTVLADALRLVASGFPAVHYIDPYCGEGLYYRPPDRPPIFTPSPDHPKRTTFERVQPALPEWYFGSPVVAARTLPGRQVSVHVSDSKSGTVLAAAAALSSELLWRQLIPTVQRPIVETVDLAVRAYDPESLHPIAPPGANVLLLDPTYSDGYDDILRRSVAACRESKALFLLLAWGMERWGLGATLSDLNVQPERARFTERNACYVIYLCTFGDSPVLREAAVAAVAGWE